jgi:protein-S-isoprenylcysteine O-methyltransferase Ste14
MVCGFLTLHSADTTVLPHKRVDRLVTHGAFRFRRNPIYMGEVLVFLGLAQLTGNIWLAIVAPLFAVAVLGLAILPEERHLEARFGEAYLDYKGRTRRWF